MEKTTEEKARAKLLKFGRKNKWNRAVAVPLLFFVMSFFHIRNYCHNNGKRFAVMLGTFFLFAVYSSFSFPAFITEDTGTAPKYRESCELVRLSPITHMWPSGTV